MSLKHNLVIQTAFLGDLILSTPVLKRIKKIFPQDKLIVVCKSGVGEFLLQEKIVDQVIEVEKSNSRSYSEALKQLINIEIRNLYCLHRSVRSQLFTAQIKADKKIGFSSLLGFWIFDDQVDFVEENPEVIRQFKILETTDKETFDQFKDSGYAYLNNIVDGHLPEIPAYFSFEHSVKPAMADQKRIAIFPGSVWATKKWTQVGFTELAQNFIRDGYKVDLLGGPSEAAFCKEIANDAVGANVLAGSLTIAETIKKLSEYDLVVSNDSASTHMAAYNNTPVITIFGPTTSYMGFRPWSNNSVIVEEKTLDCRPCGKHGHNQCPLGHHNCMKLITASTVYNISKNSL
ncbi:MAG: glycosyltransferase family 9 protein [Pseudobdellovibrio sp.]